MKARYRATRPNGVNTVRQIGDKPPIASTNQSSQQLLLGRTTVHDRLHRCVSTVINRIVAKSPTQAHHEATGGCISHVQLGKRGVDNTIHLYLELLGTTSLGCRTFSTVRTTEQTAQEALSRTTATETRFSWTSLTRTSRVSVDRILYSRRHARLGQNSERTRSTIMVTKRGSCPVLPMIDACIGICTVPFYVRNSAWKMRAIDIEGRRNFSICVLYEKRARSAHPRRILRTVRSLFLSAGLHQHYISR